MHRVDSFNYISFFVLCILYILDLLGELFLEHALRATHVASAGDQVPAGTVLATPALDDPWRCINLLHFKRKTGLN